jgi:hypothetical protein
MNTPDFTYPALVAALVGLASALVVLFKLDLTDAQQGGLTAAIGAVVTLGWFAHDAIVRHGRSNIAAAKLAAQSPPPVHDALPGHPQAVKRWRRRLRRYFRSYRSSVHYWQFERCVWVAAIPVSLATGWIRSVTLISALSIYALYQNAVQRVDQIRQQAP